MKKFNFNKIKMLLPLCLMGLPVYADGFYVDTPNDISQGMLDDGTIEAINTIISFLETVLDIIILFGAVSCVLAGITIAIRYALSDHPMEVSWAKEEALRLAFTTAGLGGIRFIMYILVLILEAL